MPAIDSTSNSDVSAVELDWYADNDNVHVTARNQKRFKIQKDKAIEALQKVNEAEAFAAQFDLLLDDLAQWLNQHNDKLSSAILTLHDGALTFLTVLKAATYDEDFHDALIIKELAIAQDADLDHIHLNTMCLPNVEGPSLRSFLDDRMVLRFTAPGNGSST